MFDIAEWVANVLVLGLGMFFWSLFLAVMFLIISELVSRVTSES
jgi:Na+-transporting methylmalonyl-CoA/oxaloacetate decarboxylase gamma subunit